MGANKFHESLDDYDGHGGAHCAVGTYDEEYGDIDQDDEDHDGQGELDADGMKQTPKRKRPSKTKRAHCKRMVEMACKGSMSRAYRRLCRGMQAIVGCTCIRFYVCARWSRV